MRHSYTFILISNPEFVQILSADFGNGAVGFCGGASFDVGHQVRKIDEMVGLRLGFIPSFV
jgi:hypothetical protein